MKTKVTKTVATAAGGAWQLGQPDFKEYEFRAHIYMARSLPALDRNGLCDPFLIIKLCGTTIKTDKRKETLNPKWYASYQTKVNLPKTLDGNLTMAPPVQVCVFDWDLIGKNDFVGGISISCQDIIDENKKTGLGNLKPKWYKLKTFDNRPSNSEILVYFQLLNMEEQKTFEMPPNIQPELLPDLSLEIVTLGMRDLKNPLGIQKSRLDFELPDGQKFGTDVSALPSVNNPNFLQILKMPVTIPKKKNL